MKDTYCDFTWLLVAIYADDVSEPSIFQNPKSGSIKVTGTYQIVNETGDVKSKATDPKLCGCGLSQDKPFCDKSHANYVALVTQVLEDARKLAKPVTPFGTWPLRANEIRKRSLELRIEAGETLVGVKFGGALEKSKDGSKNYLGIFGFLTDAMQINLEMNSSKFIYPLAEAEIVFRLSKELDREITLEEVPEFVGEVAAGIEIFDCRYGAIDPFVDDAIADNACAAGFAVGNWVAAELVDFSTAELEIYESDLLREKVSASAISGNPWAALVKVSKALSVAGEKLVAGSIVFSGSATTGIPMTSGEYRVEIKNAGAEFKAARVLVKE